MICLNIQAIEESITELLDLGAVSSLTDLTLTNCGERMSFLPLDPKYGKILLCSSDFHCV